jgi:hypothetical protein
MSTTKDTTENTAADEAGLNSTQGKIQPTDKSTKPPKDQGDTKTADAPAKPSEAPAKPVDDEQDKAARELAAVTKERDDLRVQVARLEIAAEVGVPADLLRGNTPEELREHAQALKTFAGSRTADFGAGNRGEPTRTTATDPVRSIFQSR